MTGSAPLVLARLRIATKTAGVASKSPMLHRLSELHRQVVELSVVAALCPCALISKLPPRIRLRPLAGQPPSRALTQIST